VHPVCDLVRELDLDAGQPYSAEPFAVLAHGERTGDAADMASSLGSICR